LATRLVWSSALLLLCSTVGILVVARVVLTVLLALGPVFIALGLFRATRGLCEGWLRMALAFALLPMLVTLSGAGLLWVLGPVIELITRDPLDAVQRQTPLLMLLLGCVIHLGLLLAMSWAAAGIVRGWRLRSAAASASSASPVATAGSTAAVPIRAPSPASNAGVQHAQAVQAALQAGARSATPASVQIVQRISAGSASSAHATSSAARQQRLGQRFRTGAASAALGTRFR
jgi:type IV secretion system protein VirB6